MSLPASAANVCGWTKGELIQGNESQSFDATVIDSREVVAGSLFVAIVGPNHDAHRFVGEVLQHDAAGVIVSTDPATIPDPSDSVPTMGFVVRVDDTTQALADLAHGHRQSFQGPLIGITGSNGKTTTKDLCAAILEGVGTTLATRGNLNNNFGVPLTLLRRSESTEYAIIEMGMNHRGEIATLVEIAEPNIGILTNVGSAHIEFLGSREAIAVEKGDLLASLPADGCAVVGRDDPLAFAQAKRSAARVLSFGRDPNADLCASKVRAHKNGTFSFWLESPFGQDELRVTGLAETIVENALAAAGAAFAAGASMAAVVEGLANHRGVAGRMQPRSLPNDVLVIDDSYNANPQSMQIALDTLARLETSGRRLAVLGDMGELGDQGVSAHRDAGRLAGSLGLDGLFLVGSMAEHVAAGAAEAGLSKERIHLAEDHGALARKLGELIGKGDLILVKGSRAARMERIIEAIEERSL
jgi:UDP-N-acetylmuramoyl-tripeptide--D-alanyl-D-alanine ligase